MDERTERQIGRLRSESPERTLEIGQALGLLLEPADVVGLVGDLGAGKTCLAQGIARGLEVDPRLRVASPTFTLINEYPARVPLAHVDLYRLHDLDEMAEVGIFDYLGGPQACVVEWFDQLAGQTPRDYLLVSLCAVGDAERELVVRARGERHEVLARRWLASAGRHGET